MRQVWTAMVVLSVLLVVTTTSASESLTGSKWMALGESARTFYLMGVVQGVDRVARMMGGELRSAAGSVLTYAEMQEIAYRHLLSQPELRSGPMPEIIFEALREHLVFTDRQGKRIP